MPTILSELGKAIRDEYLADAPLVNAVTGLYLQQAPAGTAEPYIVYHILSSTIDEAMNTNANRMETFTVTFNIFSKADDGGTELATVVDKFTDVFDWTTLTYTTYAHIKCQRTATANVGFVDEVWQYSLIYEITFKHV